MTSAQFYPGDRVVVLDNDEGAKPGDVGVIVSRWVDTVYVVKTQDGSYHWVSNPDIDSTDPTRNIGVGTTVQIKSNAHNHPFLRIGDLVQVVKVMNDVDYYKVLVNGEFYWLSNFELGPYIKTP